MSAENANITNATRTQLTKNAINWYKTGLLPQLNNRDRIQHFINKKLIYYGDDFKVYPNPYNIMHYYLKNYKPDYIDDFVENADVEGTPYNNIIRRILHKTNISVNRNRMRIRQQAIRDGFVMPIWYRGSYGEDREQPQPHTQTDYTPRTQTQEDETQEDETQEDETQEGKGIWRYSKKQYFQ